MKAVFALTLRQPLSQYEKAGAFFDALLAAAGIDRSHLFVVPGNHDVDNDRIGGLARTLESVERPGDYFHPDRSKGRFSEGQGAFVA